LLTAREIQTARDGYHVDGGGLFLRVKGPGASWVYRFTSPDGRRRDIGYGRALRSTIKTAGESAVLAREMARRGACARCRGSRSDRGTRTGTARGSGCGGSDEGSEALNRRH
jgi:hypothetical protein